MGTGGGRPGDGGRFRKPARAARPQAAQRAGPEPHGASYLDWQDYRKQAHSFEDLAAYNVDLVGFRSEGRAERLFITFVTSNYFAMLGVQRGLSQPDGCAPAVRVSTSTQRAISAASASSDR